MIWLIIAFSFVKLAQIYIFECVCACVRLILFISDLNFTLSEHQYNEFKVTFTA